MNLARTATLFAVLFCIPAGGTLAQQFENLYPTGTFTQAASGMIFPVSVGEFQRVAVVQYADDGSNVSGGYNLGQAPDGIIATVYVSPSPRITSFGSPRNVIEGARAEMCSGYFRAVQDAIAANSPSARLTSESKAELKQEDRTFSGREAHYSVTTGNFLTGKVEARSLLYVFCYVGGSWTVNYRFTYPADIENSEQLIADFMRDLTITIAPEE